MSANTVTFGPPQPNQVTGPQGTILDRKNNVFYTFGETRTAVPLLSSGAPVALTGQTTTTSATGGTASGLPTDPAGYLEVTINGAAAKIPYYNV